MSNGIPRRDFLKVAPAAGVAAYATAAAGAVSASPSRARPQPGASPLTAAYALRATRYSEVTLRDEFWRPKVERNAAVTIPFEVRKRVQSERALSGGVLEAAILSLATRPDAALQRAVDARVREIAAAAPTRSNREFEIAATHFLATGRRDLLDHAIRCADLLHAEFAAGDPPFTGGERDAWNCVALYRVTQDPKHLALARRYLDIRGRSDSVNRSRHNQAHLPVTEQTEAVGHAVNCVTLIASMVDVAMLTGRQEYFRAAHAMWRDAVETKMYITGGVGSTGNEGFGEPYVLPNISAYAETCAVLMFMALNHRLFLATGESRYIDVLERGMYNNALSGVAPDGDHYFYVNRLASAGDGRDLRWQHASLECCPPNLVRFLAHMPGYIYAQGADDAIHVNLYVSSQASFDVHGRRLGLVVESGLPWDGVSTIRVAAESPVRGAIRLRMPGWARGEVAPGGLYAYTTRGAGSTTISVNGSTVAATPDAAGYVALDREWRDGDVVSIAFPVETRTVAADARVTDNRGRLAIERGPIVFCAEWPDCADGDALDLLVDAAPSLAPARERLLGEAVTVLGTTARRVSNPASAARPLKLIPYYLWANRGAGEMSVWLPKEEYIVGDVGPAGGFIFHVNPNYQADGWRYLEAAPFDQSEGALWGCFRREIPGARGTAIGTGRQNTADMLAACAEPATAARLCESLSVNGVRGWFLPSRDELSEMYRGLAARGVGNFEFGSAKDNVMYWASTQNTADMAVHTDFVDWGRVHGDDKDFPRRVRAIRAF
ncbi:MAG: beta-L-arabinofuranosidase domain-containing protein [Gemmatimonadota bacterium]